MSKAIPVTFLPKNVRRIVKKDCAGVYVLGNEENGKFVPKYIGRSDYSIRHRLLTHNHMYDYEYFVFMYVNGMEAAFLMESKWWHDCLNNGIDIDNKIHPDTPSGAYIECPYCAFAKDMNELLYHKRAG